MLTRRLANIAKPLSTNLPRFFSVYRTKIPKNLSNIINNNALINIPQDNIKDIEIISLKILEELRHHANFNNCQESKNFLKALSIFANEKENTGLFIENNDIFTANKKQFLASFSNFIAYIGNFTPLDFRYNEIGDPIRNDSAYAPRILLPHSDDSFNADSKLSLIILFGVDANQQNYRTYTIKNDKIISKLSEKSLAILQEKIFLASYQTESNSIISKDPSNQYKITFDCNLSVKDYLWDEKKLKNSFSNEEIFNAVCELYETTMNIYKNEEYQSFYIGNNDILAFKNHKILHGRDQEGVATEYKDYNRILGVMGYEVAKAEALPLKNTLTNYQTK